MNHCVWKYINICTDGNCKCSDFEHIEQKTGQSILNSYNNALQPIISRFVRIKIVLSERGR